VSYSKSPPEFDYYTISRVLGEGGMGLVYLAHDRRTGLPVAIKVMSKRVFDPSLQARFLKENRILSALNHRNIVRCYEITESRGGIPSIVMEYVDGVDVRAFEGRPYPELLPLMIQALMGLSYLRAQNVVHRDLSSNNIIVTLENRKRVAKILDFGVAKILQEQDADANMKTQTGQFLGKFAFASPELFVSSEVDWRSDVFSLGVIFHRLLTTTPPITVGRSANYFEWLVAHQTEHHFSVEAPAGVPPLPRELAGVVRKMLARTPDERPQSYEEIIDVLHGIQLGVPAGLEPDPLTLETLPPAVAEPVPSSGDGRTARTPSSPPVSRQTLMTSSASMAPREPEPPVEESQQKRWPDLETTLETSAPGTAPASETAIPPAPASPAPDQVSDKTERFDDVLAKLRQESAVRATPPEAPAPPPSPASTSPPVPPPPAETLSSPPPAPPPAPPARSPETSVPVGSGERRAVAAPTPAGRRLVIYGEPPPPAAPAPPVVPPAAGKPARPASPPVGSRRSGRWLGIGLIVAAIVLLFVAVLWGLISLLRGAAPGSPQRSRLAFPDRHVAGSAISRIDPTSS
jgi:serine/threonine protein kinase